MSNEVMARNENILALPKTEVLSILRTSLYPGASDDSINMVLSYCKAAGLDVMQKPVHIVPMYDSKSGGMRDVIMPGVGLYRTQAARTGEYAGVSEPQFGPMIDTVFASEQDGKRVKPEMSISYPEWCKVTVRRLLANGMLAEFTATEYWLENFATAGKWSKQPNNMWSKRPRGQIAKCAEAQALRKAFPELGAQPTADEMEGKSIDTANDITPTISRSEEAEAKAKKPYPQASFDKMFPKWEKYIEDPNPNNTVDSIVKAVATKGVFTANQLEMLNAVGKIITGEVA